KVLHPLLMLLANIHSDIQSKALLHAFIPVAFLPIVKFIHNDQWMKGVLSDQLYHEALNIVIVPLKQVVLIGIMLLDLMSNSWCCYTLLAGCIINIPEAHLITCIQGMTSLITLADYTQFGDPFHYNF
ncbi:hypothetical protein HD554DRAFT_2020432, partial [Boletus coccyginus]